MKKVLFATTALVASAGIASAQGVELSGSAEMGIVGGDRYTETQFFQSVDVRFTMSGETDNGLTFGATVDLDDVADMAITGWDPVDIGGNGQFADYTVFLSGSFGTLTMGDTDGAFDWALQEVNVVGGSIDDSETAHAGFNGNAGLDGVFDGQVVRYDYSFGDFAFAVSAELDDTGFGDPAFGIGAKYSGDLGGVKLGVGVGYQTTGLAVMTDSIGPLAGAYDVVGVSLDATFDNGLRGAVNYSQLNAPAGWVDPDTHWAIGVGYTMDALSIGVNYGVYSGGLAGVIADSEGFGVAVNYDLGGGATVQFGYGTGKSDDGTFTNTQTASVDSFSLGIAMSF